MIMNQRDVTCLRGYNINMLASKDVGECQRVKTTTVLMGVHRKVNCSYENKHVV
jgi:hypothetical protein